MGTEKGGEVRGKGTGERVQLIPNAHRTRPHLPHQGWEAKSDGALGTSGGRMRLDRRPNPTATNSRVDNVGEQKRFTRGRRASSPPHTASREIGAKERGSRKSNDVRGHV
eukprot:6171913-Pleurochrysis_carterae.AAC.3